jgi:hypothetical protein
MTTIYSGIKVLTYAEWIKLPAVKEMGATLKDCVVCDGAGDHECECGDTHECRACSGTGKCENFHDIYEAILRSEIVSLKLWIDGDPIGPRNKYLFPLPAKNNNREIINLTIHGASN